MTADANLELPQQVDGVLGVVIDARILVWLVDGRAAEAAHVRGNQPPAVRQRLHLAFPHRGSEREGMHQENDAGIALRGRRVEVGDRPGARVEELALHARRS